MSLCTEPTPGGIVSIYYMFFDPLETPCAMLVSLPATDQMKECTAKREAQAQGRWPRPVQEQHMLRVVNVRSKRWKRPRLISTSYKCNLFLARDHTGICREAMTTCTTLTHTHTSWSMLFANPRRASRSTEIVRPCDVRRGLPLAGRCRHRVLPMSISCASEPATCREPDSSGVSCLSCLCTYRQSSLTQI
jgi:hypothetical protein